MCLCNTCKAPFERVWVVGKRSGVLKRLLNIYKFERSKSAYKDLGDLILGALPELPAETVVVPIPTIPNHIRIRGYDHTLLIAKYIAKERNLKCKKILSRQQNTKQLGLSAQQRDDNAKHAFVLSGNVCKETPYLLVDDIITTGATVKYASKKLAEAGAEHVWVAAVAKQTLD